MSRRRLLSLTAAIPLAAAGAGAATLRLHRRPRRAPLLTDAHLAAELRRMRGAEGRRALFVGNSMTLRHDVPARVAALAARDGIALSVAAAGATGARLVETARIPAFRRLAAGVPWDAIVLQGFTKTPLRVWDRWGAALAMRHIAWLAGQPPALLFPSWPDAPGHRVYRGAPGFLEATPGGPADFAARTMRFHERVAAAHGFAVAPVPDRWLATGPDPGLYAPDLHHASPAGAALAAEVVWASLRPLLGRPAAGAA